MSAAKKNFACTFISGDDDFIVSREGQDAWAEMTKDITDEFSREVLDAAAQKVDEAETLLAQFRSAAQTLSMFGDRKVIWLRGFNLLADTQTGRAEGTQQVLTGIQEMLTTLDPAAVEVLITAYPVDRRKKGYKWFAKNAHVRDIKGGGDAASLGPLITEEAGKLGVKIQHRAVESLIALVGGNTRVVLQELNKLATYLGPDGGEITERLVLELVPSFGESEFFEVAEAFFALDLHWTLDAIRKHFFSNKDCRGILSTLQNRNRLLIQIRSLIDSGELRAGSRGIPSAALEATGANYSATFGDHGTKSSYNLFSQNGWYIGNKVAPTAQKVPLRKLINFQVAFVEAFQHILDRPNEQETILRNLAIRCLG